MRRTLFLLTLFLAASSAAVAQGWEDPFDGDALDPRWTWRAPVNGPAWSLKDRPGWLRVTVPQRPNGFNHWNQPTAVDEAPQLRAPAPAGDWEFEARIQLQQVDPGSNFQVGLAVGASDAQLVTWGPFFGPGLPGGQVAPEVWMEPTGTSGYKKVPGEARDVTLRLTKIGYTLLAALRRGEGDWADGGTFTLLRPPQFLALIGKTFFNGPGVAFDVDYARLIPREPRPEPPVEASVRVDAAAAGVPLSPLRYGHFVEHVGRCVYGGLWAEMLANRKLSGQADANGVVEKWGAVGAGPGIVFAPDNRVFYAPVQSQRIARQAAGEACGLAQAGLGVRAGVGLVGRVVLRREGDVGPVTVALRAGERVLGEERIADAGVEWQTHGFTFPAPEAAVADATLSITFRGAGTLWVGAVSLMPGDHVDGWRNDVLALAREIRPPVIRWPGGKMASGYRWEDGIGPADRRPVRWERAWSAWEPNDVGTHEFLRLCELLGAQPYIVANAGEGDAREAARWVEYCNGTAETPQGRLRAGNGHAEPFGVRLWGLGNELYGKSELGNLPGPQYALKAVEFARAVRAVDPAVRLIGVGVEGDTSGGWNRYLLSAAGADLDYLSVHFYRTVDLAGDPMQAYTATVAASADVERALRRTIDTVAGHAPAGKTVPIALDEWNVWPKDATPQAGMETQQTLAAGLFACGVFNTLTRLGDKVGMANLALLVNALGAIRTTPTGAYVTPVYLAFRLHAGRAGTLGLPTTVESPRIALPGVADLAALDAAATLSEDRRTLYVSLVNRHPSQPARVKLDAAGFEAAEGEWAAVVGDDLAAANTAEAPNAVRLETRPLKAEELREITVPAHTAAIVTLRAR